MAAAVASPITLGEPQLDKLYFLPRASADLERDRLDVQHQAITLALGGLCPDMEAIKRLLDPRKDHLAVLDIGSGSGAWAVGMARIFPHVQVLGVDLVPNIPSFEVGDLNSGLTQYAGHFDVIHGRGLGRGIEDFPEAHQSMVRLLRPGGLIVLAESQLRAYGVDKEPTPHWSDEDEDDLGPSSTPRSAFSRLQAEIGKIVNQRGKIPNASVAVPPKLHLYLTQAMDAVNPPHSTPSSIFAEQVFLPVGWAGLPDDGPALEDGKKIGELMTTNVASFMPAARALLIDGGVDAKRVDRWIERSVWEIEGNLRIYLCWFYTWGFRN